MESSLGEPKRGLQLTQICRSGLEPEGRTFVRRCLAITSDQLVRRNLATQPNCVFTLFVFAAIEMRVIEDIAVAAPSQAAPTNSDE